MTTKGSTTIINVYVYNMYILYNIISVRKTQNSQLPVARQSSFRHNLVIEPCAVDLIRYYTRGGDIIYCYGAIVILPYTTYTHTHTHTHGCSRYLLVVSYLPRKNYHTHMAGVVVVLASYRGRIPRRSELVIISYL